MRILEHWLPLSQTATWTQYSPTHQVRDSRVRFDRKKTGSRGHERMGCVPLLTRIVVRGKGEFFGMFK